MDKKSGPTGTSKPVPQREDQRSSETDSGSPIRGSEKTGYYLNDRGQKCYGNECVNITVDSERREIVVNVKQDPGCDIQPLVEEMRAVIGKGARTVYEVESEIRAK